MYSSLRLYRRTAVIYINMGHAYFTPPIAVIAEALYRVFGNVHVEPMAIGLYSLFKSCHIALLITISLLDAQMYLRMELVSWLLCMEGDNRKANLYHHTEKDSIFAAKQSTNPFQDVIPSHRSIMADWLEILTVTVSNIAWQILPAYLYRSMISITPLISFCSPLRMIVVAAGIKPEEFRGLENKIEIHRWRLFARLLRRSYHLFDSSNQWSPILHKWL